MTGPAGKPLALRLSEGLGSNVEHEARGRHDGKGHLLGCHLATMTFVRNRFFNIGGRYRVTARMPTVLLRLTQSGLALSGELLAPRLNRFWKLVPQMGILTDAQTAFLDLGGGSVPIMLVSALLIRTLLVRRGAAASWLLNPRRRRWIC